MKVCVCIAVVVTVLGAKVISLARYSWNRTGPYRIETRELLPERHGSRQSIGGNNGRTGGVKGSVDV